MLSFISQLTQSAIYQDIQTGAFLACELTLSAKGAEIMDMCPSLILGSSKLLTWDKKKKTLALSNPFQELLYLLIDLDILDCQVLKASSLLELNAILQRPQGKGGLLRAAGQERFEMEEKKECSCNKERFQKLLKSIGLSLNQQSYPSSIDSCVIFAGMAQRTELRIQATLKLLKEKKIACRRWIALASNRKIVELETKFLQEKIAKLPSSRQLFWEKALQNKEATEALAFQLLWEHVQYQTGKSWGPLYIQNSIRSGIGSSRPTTDITTDDLAILNKNEKDSSFLAVIEYPFIRLGDQLRVSILTDGKQASFEQIKKNIEKMEFHFFPFEAESEPLLTVVLDEVARNLYRICDTLNYLEKLSRENPA